MRRCRPIVAPPVAASPVRARADCGRRPRPAMTARMRPLLRLFLHVLAGLLEALTGRLEVFPGVLFHALPGPAARARAQRQQHATSTERRTHSNIRIHIALSCCRLPAAAAPPTRCRPAAAFARPRLPKQRGHHLLVPIGIDPFRIAGWYPGRIDEPVVSSSVLRPDTRHTSRSLRHDRRASLVPSPGPRHLRYPE